MKVLTWARNLLAGLTVAYRLALAVALLALVGLSGSCLVRSWREHRTPKPTPVQVDHGVPKVESAPPVVESLPIARPALSEAELSREAERFGYVLAKPSKRPRSAGDDYVGAPVAVNPGRTVPGGIEASAGLVAPWNGIPVKLTEERFRHEASKAEIDVAAFYVGEGRLVDLRGSWAAWTAPKPPASDTCDGGLVGAGRGATWRLGAGAIASAQGVGVGPVGGWNYDGFRILGASATADVAAGWSEGSGALGLGMVGVSF